MKLHYQFIKITERLLAGFTIISMVIFPQCRSLAQDSGLFLEISINAPFDQAIQADHFLMSGSVAVKEIDGKRYIISVACTANKSFDKPDDVNAKLSTMKVAQMKAKAEIGKFLQSEITTETRLDKTTVETTTQENQTKERTKLVEKAIREITFERAHELLNQAERIGSWYSSDNRMYYCAVVMPIGKTE